tara:strand:- start:456 stop:629 length:174 start_codon:yes stop_codon:yes gene_type:complete
MKNLLKNISFIIVAIFGTTNFVLFAALLSSDKLAAFLCLTLCVLSFSILSFLINPKK